MKKILLSILVPFVVWCSCTEKTYNYYLTEEMGSLAGVVEPAESGARVSAWQGKEVAFTYIDSMGYFILSDLPVGTYTIKIEAVGYTTYESKPYTIYGGGTTTVGTITLKPFPDLISSVYPPDKAVGVSALSYIRIYFKESMNKESATNAFSINPTTEGSFTWRDRTNYYGRELEFNPTTNLLPMVMYTVTLDTAAQDTAGNNLTKPFSFSFTTVGVGIERFSPSNGQTDVGTNISISIYFSTVMDQQSVEEAFSIDPPTSGSFHWGGVGPKSRKEVLGGSADYLWFWFQPDDYLNTSTIYTVALETTAQDTGGIPIPEPLSFSFTTEDLKVSRTSPHDGDVDSRLSSGITVYFNTSMINSTTEDAFSISPSVDGDFYWTPNSTSFNFKPRSEYLASNTEYEIKIDTAASDIYGNHFSQSYQFSFITEGINLSSSPNDNSSGLGTRTYVRVIFNTAMDQWSVINAFSITPFVEGRFVWYGNSRFHFVPDQVLVSNTFYTVNIDSSAGDLYGINLKHSYSFSFTTDEIRIISTYPDNRATYVGSNTVIEISFNTDMDQASAVNAFRMIDSDSIEVNGAFSWSGLYKLTFDPDSTLALNEEYTVIIAIDASDIRGANMLEEFVLWFKTRP